MLKKKLRCFLMRAPLFLDTSHENQIRAPQRYTTDDLDTSLYSASIELYISTALKQSFRSSSLHGVEE